MGIGCPFSARVFQAICLQGRLEALEGKARGKGKNVGIANIESSPSNENIVLHLWTVVMHALRPRILLSPTNDLCAQIRQFTRVSG